MEKQILVENDIEEKAEQDKDFDDVELDIAIGEALDTAKISSNTSNSVKSNSIWNSFCCLFKCCLPGAAYSKIIVNEPPNETVNPTSQQN